MKVGIYARYSSDNQRDASIADQFRICRAFAERQGWTIADEYSDHAVSGATLLRPGFQSLMRDAGIVRNRLKIQSARTNALAFLAVQKEFGSFDKYVWRFVGGRPIVLKGRKVPARTAESDALSKDLLKRGFKFVGSTICYAYMQAVGMANDHSKDCFRRRS